MTLEDRVRLQRLRLFRRAEQLSNVSAAYALWHWRASVAVD